MARMLQALQIGVLAKKASGQYGSKNDAGYADPGYQADGQPRYPLKNNGKLDPGRIRAAWDYVHVAKNAAAYSPAHLRIIERRIVTAWRSAINPKGPPGA